MPQREMLEMNRLDFEAIDALIDMALKEDVGTGDITTEAIVDKRVNGTAQILAKKPTVVAGLFLVERILRRLSPDVTVELLVPEGKKVAAGTVLCHIWGPYTVLLLGERTLLNFLQRMCGVATLTQRYVSAVRRNRCKVLDTRKTAPGQRSLQKYAVRAGGGTNHRTGLYDAILIKENHIAAAGGVPEAIARVKKHSPGIPVEIEVTNMEELVLAVEYGADIVLLDNMELPDISKAVAMVGERVELEVSGGVTLSTIRAIAATGVHRISVGALTHSAPAADLSMLIVPEKR